MTAQVNDPWANFDDELNRHSDKVPQRSPRKKNKPVTLTKRHGDATMGDMTGKQLRKWREDHGHSQASLAKALGFSLRKYIRIETGVQPVPLVLELALSQVPERPMEERGRWPEK